MKILLIEDENKIAKFVSQGLREEGFVVQTASDGQDGFQKANQEEYDLIILDLMLPKLDGLTLCRNLRSLGKNMPILMLTAKDSVENKIEGLNSGADDYLTKPFSFNELLARVRALERRRRENFNNILEVGDLKLNQVTHKVSFKDKEIDLSSREFALLQYFFRRQGHVLTRTNLAESVWGYDFDTGTNVINVYVNYLRNKLKEVTKKDWIQTRRNQGYIFDTPE